MLFVFFTLNSENGQVSSIHKHSIGWNEDPKMKEALVSWPV